MMEFCRSRLLHKPLKIIFSSPSPLKNPNYPGFSNSFKNLTLISPSLSSPSRVLYIFSSFLRPVASHRHVTIRCLSSFSQELDYSANNIIVNDNQQIQSDNISCSEEEDSYQEHLIEVQQEKLSRFIPVKAFFLCTSIDLKSLQLQNAYHVIPANSWAPNYIVLRYYDAKGDQQALESGLINESHCHYMVVFHYGSIVLFNVSDHEASGYLKLVEKHATGLLAEMRKDEYTVVEKPTLESWMQGGLDHIILKNLSIDGICTIGSVLGQSIALDYYIRQVDGMVAEFTDINREMEKTGNFTMERKKLFQLVGKANSNLTDVILKLGLLERPDIAWKNANYAQIWEHLRDEYELTQRFGSLDSKLKFVEHIILFLQEMQQNRKSDFLKVITDFLKVNIRKFAV